MIERMRKRIEEKNVDVSMKGVKEDWIKMMEEVGNEVERKMDIKSKK